MSNGFRPEFDLITESDASVRDRAASYGLVALDGYGNLIHEDCGMLPGKMSSNVAEYLAILKAVELAVDLGYVRSLQVRSDSRTCIKQLRNGYLFLSNDMNDAAARVLDKVERLEYVHFMWIPRRLNGHSDRLASAAFSNSVRSTMRTIKRESYPSVDRWYIEDDWENDE